MKVWTVWTWAACLALWGCGDKDNGDTGSSAESQPVVYRMRT